MMRCSRHSDSTPVVSHTTHIDTVDLVVADCSLLPGLYEHDTSQTMKSEYTACIALFA